MDARSAVGLTRQDGFVSAEVLALVVLSGVVLVLVTNLVLVSYARGAVVGALEEGARQARMVGAAPEQACAARAEEALEGLLGGRIGDGLGPVACRVSDGSVTASVEGAMPALAPGMPPFDLGATVSLSGSRR